MHEQGRLKIKFRDRASFQEALHFLRPRVTSERRLFMAVDQLSLDERVKLRQLGAVVGEDTLIGAVE